MQKKILIVDCGSTKVPDIIRMLQELNAATERVLLESLPEKVLSDYMGIVISGAPVLLTEESQKYLINCRPVKETAVPVLGICFGHQLIGLLHGAKVSLCKEDRDWQKIEKISDSKLLKNFGQLFRMSEDHTECITLPDDFVLVASSSICENEAMEHIHKPIYGVQFHPETSEEEGKKLFSNFLEICKK